MNIVNRETIAYLFYEKHKLTYVNLNEKDFTDNKQFWQTVKPLLSGKIKSPEKITLVEQRETLETDGNTDDQIIDLKTAENFNIFFSNAANDLKIPGFHGAVPLADNISHPIFRTILKYTNHPSTIPIKGLNNTSMFSFSNISVLMLKKKLENLILEKQLKIPTFQSEY